ncbi:hypothetical protein ABZ564_32470, partial [Streptomyces sp. NPDC019224]
MTTDDPSPYEWLEDAEDSRTRKWMAEQQNLCLGQFAELAHRTDLRAALADLHAYQSSSAPAWRGGKEFYSERSTDGKSYAILVRDHRCPHAPPVRLFDSVAPGRSSTQKVTAWYVSQNGCTLAVELAERGQETAQLLLLDTATRAEQAIPLDGYVSGSFAWHGDGSFFFVRTGELRFPRDAEVDDRGSDGSHERNIDHGCPQKVLT